jgi:hypothetical protein
MPDHIAQPEEDTMEGVQSIGKPLGREILQIVRCWFGKFRGEILKFC